MPIDDHPQSPQPPYPALDYLIVDVFAGAAFTGNPLAVVLGADGLATEQLRAIAVEFNLSETTFPVALTSDDRAAAADYRVRIFTPEGEIPFAGHPTLGTAWALQNVGLLEPGSRTQACGAGLIGVEVPADPDGLVELSAVPRDHARPLGRAEVSAVAPLVGLEAADVIGPAFSAGCGLSWLYLEVAAEAVERSRPSGTRLDEVDVDLSSVRDPIDGIDVYAVTRADSGSLQIDSRVFVPGFGIPEDPATGSAAAGLGLALVAAGHAAGEGPTSFTVTQGVAMGRPSSLLGVVHATAATATRVHVAGHVVPIATGQIRIPELIS